MLKQLSTIPSMGIKGQAPQTRWQEKTYQQLVLLLIEDPAISQNIAYLLTHYQEAMLKGASALAQALNIPEITLYISSAYEALVDSPYKTILVDDPKAMEAEVFQPDHLVHTGETLLQIQKSLEASPMKSRMITLSGEINAPGVYEVPMDMALKDIIATVAQGTLGDLACSFVQVGGPLGPVLTADQLDQVYDTKSLLTHGRMVSCAKIEVATSKTCPLQWISKVLSYLAGQSCGQCVYCREGIFQLHRITADATEGKSRHVDMDVIGELDTTMKALSLCDFGRSASTPLMTLLQGFGDEFDKHMERKQCSTYACRAYTHFHVNPETCVGCGDCMTACPVHAISGGDKMIHVIDPSLCVACGACERTCSQDAIIRYGNIKPKGPVEPVPVGSFSSEGGLGGKRRRRRSQ